MAHRTKIAIAVYSTAILIAMASICLVLVMPQPYGWLSLTCAVGVALGFYLLKSPYLRWPLTLAMLATGVFCIAAALSFMRDNRERKSQFDLPTAVKFENGSFEECSQKAKREGKVLFVDFYTVWCGPCLQFSRTVLLDPIVGEKMNSSFINMKLDAEKGEGKILARKYAVSAYPTLLVIAPRGEVLEQLNTHYLPDAATMLAAAAKYSPKRNGP